MGAAGDAELSLGQKVGSVNVEIVAKLLFGTHLLLATAAGVGVSGLCRWNVEYGNSRLPLFYGALLGPFLAGFASLAALLLAPGSSGATHVAMVGAFLVIVAFASRNGIRTIFKLRENKPYKMWDWGFLFLLVIWFLVLLTNATLLPLTQNDALEYAMVGRELFHSRSLENYPVMNPETNLSGFFGPWTHPPLYVATIYLSSLLQGHADAPGLMRWISPWFAIVGTLVLYAVGGRHGRVGGFVAALLFISAPLMFLGSDSGLIDSVVTAGFLVAVIPLFAWSQRRARDIFAIGAATGVGMWTHSQAVLLIPMALAIVGWTRLLRPVALLRASGLFMAGALLLGGWPYWRNIGIFGSPISDNPLVFALSSLQWDRYFTVGRGLGTFAAVIQYGWLKGVSAIESYSFGFWVAAFGFCYFLKSELRKLRASLFQSVHSHPDTLDDVTVYFFLLVIYQAGVMLSTSLGIELMVKNERYLLSMLPFAALLAGAFIARLWNSSEQNRRLRLSLLGLKWIFVLVLVLELAVFSFFRMNENGITVKTLIQSHEEILENRPEFQVVRYLRDQTPDGALVFSLKPADMYYANRRMISYLDPRLESFYGLQDAKLATDELLRLGVSYVHIPDYGVPPVYNSVLMRILADPSLTELVFSADGNQIYRLGNSGLRVADEKDVSPTVTPWVVQSRLIVGGRKMLLGRTGQAHAYDPADFSPSVMPFGLFNRNWATVFRVVNLNVVSTEAGSELVLVFNLAGEGLVRVRVGERDSQGNVVRGAYLRSGSPYVALEAITKKEPESYFKRFQPNVGTEFLDIEIEVVGNSSVVPKHVVLQSLLKHGGQLSKDSQERAL